jgi:hypothetical protein
MKRMWFTTGIVAIALLVACNQVDDQALVRPSMIIIEPGVSITKSFTVAHAQSFEPRVTAKSAVETEVDVTAGMAEVGYEIVVEDVLAYESDRADIADIEIGNTGSTGIIVDIVDTLYCGDGAGNADLAVPIATVVEAFDVPIAAGATHTIAGPFGPFDVAGCPDAATGIVKDVVNRVVVRDAATDAVIAEADLLATPLATSSIFAAYLVDEESVPTHYTFTDATLTKDGEPVDITETLGDGTFTVVTDEVVGAGTYLLTKVLTRDAGVMCEPGQVLDGAFMSVDGTREGMIGTEWTATIDLLCTPTGGEGCTPGFWQNWTGAPPGLQPNAWAKTGYHWSDPFTTPGFVDAFRSKSLLGVLELGGGGKNALGRHAVAAVLNAAHPDVSYDLTEAQVVAMFNDVIENKGDVNALKGLFERLNEQGCPLSQALY